MDLEQLKSKPPEGYRYLYIHYSGLGRYVNTDEDKISLKIKQSMKYKIRLRGDADTRRYWLNDIELKPKRSQKLFNHSPDGFNHGYGGSGPAQLALAILLELTDDDNLSVRRHQDVKFKYIAGLPQGEDFDEELEIEIL